MHSALPRAAWASDPIAARRFVAFYVPNGIQSVGWTPDREGADFDLKSILATCGRCSAGSASSAACATTRHAPTDLATTAGTGSFLTAAHCYKTEGAGIRNGVSLDQHIASALGDDYRFKSMAVASEGRQRRRLRLGLQLRLQPQHLVDQRDHAGARAGRAHGCCSTDSLVPHPSSLARKSGRRARPAQHARLPPQRRTEPLEPPRQRRPLKLDQYLTAINELERQIDFAESQVCAPGEIPGAAEDLPTKVRQMLDLLVLALQCDLTPVATYMLGNAGSRPSDASPRDLGGHRTLSHHQNNPDMIDQLVRIAAWEVEQVGVPAQPTRCDPRGSATSSTRPCCSLAPRSRTVTGTGTITCPCCSQAAKAWAATQGLHQRVPDTTPIANLFVRSHGKWAPTPELPGDSNRILSL